MGTELHQATQSFPSLRTPGCPGLELVGDAGATEVRSRGPGGAQCSQPSPAAPKLPAQDAVPPPGARG